MCCPAGAGRGYYKFNIQKVNTDGEKIIGTELCLHVIFIKLEVSNTAISTGDVHLMIPKLLDGRVCGGHCPKLQVVTDYIACVCVYVCIHFYFSFTKLYLSV